jgi:hypothetical protein
MTQEKQNMHSDLLRLRWGLCGGRRRFPAFARIRRVASIVGTSWVLALPALAATRSPASLPDWSGAWENAGAPDNLDLFDGKTADPPGCRATTQPCRSHPPLTAAWEEKYRANLRITTDGRLQPPSASCMPRGTPANMRTTDAIEFVVRPEEVWIFIENTPLPRRIFTDGRSHYSGREAYPTLAGDSIGHWEGRTLVVETVNLKPYKIIDRSGLELGPNAKIVEHIRRLDSKTMEDVFSIDDPEVLTKTWVVRRLYRKVPQMFDFACAENIRNKVNPDGTTDIRDAHGKVLSSGSDK